MQLLLMTMLLESTLKSLLELISQWECTMDEQRALLFLKLIEEWVLENGRLSKSETLGEIAEQLYMTIEHGQGVGLIQSIRQA